ncbi:DUF4145 domain-containing protein (plasmid) [Rossellomorea sp. AcN35-11]|nr:DUF4145 domain-containing protein [Rossellomorea aquimaris]WJV31984.1 DUF4145 domain-containing protein [Rossellomorea sp. AcN35-11]
MAAEVVGYIKEQHPKLFEELALSKQYKDSDPQSALFKIRYVAEKLLDDILLQFSIYSDPHESFYNKTRLVEDRIKSIGYDPDEEKVHMKMFNQLNYIRIKGNEAVHEDSQIKKDIELCLDYIHAIDGWLSIYSMTENEAKYTLYTLFVSETTKKPQVELSIDEIKTMKIKEWANDQIELLEIPSHYIKKYAIAMTVSILRERLTRDYSVSVRVQDAVQDSEDIEMLGLEGLKYVQAEAYADALVSYFSPTIHVQVSGRSSSERTSR